MNKLIFPLLISAAFITVHVYGDSGNIHNVPPEPPTNLTTSKPTVPPTTPPPSTTEITTVTTSATPKPTSPTTPKPTSPEPPTPAPTPAPLPPNPSDPTKGTWNVTYSGSNVTCIRIQFAMQILVPYFHTAQNKTVNTTVNVPDTAALLQGDCGEKEDIVLQWISKGNASENITFNFGQNASAKIYMLQNIQIHIVPDSERFPGIENKTVIILNHNIEEFKTTLLKSYKCEKQQLFNLTDIIDQPKGFLNVSQLQFQAFGNSTENVFFSAEDCDYSDTPDVVPIAVGCALALLVIAVLIAYLIGRRRRQARGYLSM